jgi:hypothetical protein
LKLPSFQFYPGDWLRDPVSGCSLAAQGLWLRLMILMHDSERYGYLSQNGLPIPHDHLARRCGSSPDEFNALLLELESAGVPSRTKDGIIYSRRMTRDAEDRAKNADRQRRHYERTKGEPNGKPNTEPNGNLTTTSHKPNSTSSSSSSNIPYGRKDSANGSNPKSENVIWDIGLKALISAGAKESAARSFLGGQIKKFGAQEVAIVVVEAVSRNAVNPKEYIAKVLLNRKAIPKPGKDMVV